MMKLNKTLFRTGLLILVFVSQASCLNCSASDERATAHLYKSFINSSPVNTAQLNMFFNLMPKGGDLHHHYSGSIYAETYLDWVKAKGYWINSKTLKIDTKKTPASISVEQLYKDNTRYRKLLSLWSDMDYGNHFHLQPPPDSNFFDTFGYFGPISGPPFNSGLKILKQRALQENVQYIETMLKTVGYKLSDPAFDKKIRQAVANNPAQRQKVLFQIFDNFAAKKIKAGEKFSRAIIDYIKMVESLSKEINTEPDFRMAYQTYATRSAAPSVIFSKLYAGFAAASKSKHIVGVNIVGPENGIVALQDYTLHMYMFKYLKDKFTTVKTAMHAGELVLGLVRPKDLVFHINEAVNIAQSNRIGHGIDIFSENEPLKLLTAMKTQQVAVEINLSSNEFILGVKDGMHPIHIYKKAGVPLVISTDDSGVSRNNLSNEYMLLAARYKPEYKEIKKYVYNSAKYSFLADEDKLKLKKLLDNKFIEFEKKMAQYAKLRH